MQRADTWPTVGPRVRIPNARTPILAAAKQMFGAYSAGGLGTALHVGVPYVAGEQFSVADITLLVTIGFAAKAIDLALPGEHLALRRWYDRVSRRSSTSAGAASTAVIRPMAFRPLKRLTASRR